MKACRDIDRKAEMGKFREKLKDLIQKSGLNYHQIRMLVFEMQLKEMMQESDVSAEQMREMFFKIFNEKNVEIEHASYTPEQCGRDK